jgi:hypothetical protein
MNVLQPAETLGARRHLSGVLVPARIEVRNLSILTREPDHHRCLVGDHPEHALALLKCREALLSQRRHPPDRIDARSELARREGFHHIVIGACSSGVGACFCARTGRQHDHRQMAEALALPNALEQAETVELRHHHVGEQHIRRKSLECRPSCFAIRHHLHIVVRAEQALQIAAHVRVVIGDQQAHALFQDGNVVALRGIRGGGRLRQPAQSLLDERLRADRRSCECARCGDSVWIEVLLSLAQDHLECRSAPNFRFRTH